MVVTLRRQIEANQTPKLDIASCLLLASFQKLEQYRISDALGASGQQQFRDLQELYLVKGSSPRSSPPRLCFRINIDPFDWGWLSDWENGQVIEKREDYRNSPFEFFDCAKAMGILVKKV